LRVFFSNGEKIVGELISLSTNNPIAFDDHTALAGSGSGPHDPGMEVRVAKLESDVGHIQRDIGEIKTDVREIKKALETDFRLLFGALIVVALGLAGVMAKGFHWL
jgi:hypothetical protein